MYFRGLQSMIRVYCGSKLVFRQGVDAYSKGRMPGRTLCYVPLPDNYSGKRIRIEITAGENGAFTDLGPFTLGNQQDLFHKFINERQLPHLFGTLLTFFALFQFLCAPYLIAKNRLMTRQVFSALLMLSAGVYILAFYNLFNIYISNQEVNTFLEFLSICGIPTAMCGYLQYIVKGKEQRLYRIFTSINFGLLAVLLALHFTNIVHISNSLFPLYALCVIEIIPFITFLIREARKSTHRVTKLRANWLDEIAEMLPIAGMMLFAFSSFIDMGFFLYTKVVLRSETTATILFTTASGMVLAICQMLSYLLQGVSFLRSEATKQHLVGMAYTDPLTGLANRTKCERSMEELTTSSGPYTIAKIDLDALKAINEGLGDAKGDEMIKNFSEELQSEFGDARLVGRMGSDEFLLVFDGLVPERAHDKLIILSEKIEKLKTLIPDLPFNMSFGVATSDEIKIEEKAYDVYLLADRRMYAMKRKKHEERGGVK